MLKKATRRISAFLVAIFAGVLLFPSNAYAQQKNNVSLDLQKIPLKAVTLEKAVIAGLTVNENSVCSYALKSTPENVYQCLFALQVRNISNSEKSVDPKTISESEEIEKEAEKGKVISSPTPSPTPVATPIAIPSPAAQPTPVPQSFTSPAGSLSADKYFDMINSHRAAIGLPAFEKHPQLCEVTASRGPELNDEIFGNSYIHAGFRKRNLPYWATENMIGYPTEEIGFSWWMRSSVHRQAIESTDYKYACGVCSGKACAMLFTSFTPKQI